MLTLVKHIHEAATILTLHADFNVVVDQCQHGHSDRSDRSAAKLPHTHQAAIKLHVTVLVDWCVVKRQTQR